MPIDAGKLRTLITLQKPTKAKTAAGKRSITWANVADVWCEFVESRGREFMAAKQVNLRMTHLLRIYHRTDVTSEWRATSGSEVFNFDAVTNPGRGNVELLIEAIEEAA